MIVRYMCTVSLTVTVKPRLKVLVTKLTVGIYAHVYLADFCKKRRPETHIVSTVGKCG